MGRVIQNEREPILRRPLWVLALSAGKLQVVLEASLRAESKYRGSRGSERQQVDLSQTPMHQKSFHGQVEGWGGPFLAESVSLGVQLGPWCPLVTAALEH